MEVVAVPPSRRESIRTFHFPRTQESGYRVMTLKSVSKSYGDLKVYEKFNFEVLRGEKSMLVGENGAGKSTLLKIISGILDCESGTRLIGHNVSIGYFSQTRMDVLNSLNTVLEEACSVALPGMKSESVRTILGAFLFSGDDVEKGVCVLSGGEKSRLILSKLLINPPNFLILDEPTTHLDVDAVDALIKALNEYEGTLLCISHDIYFARSVANVVFEIKDGRATKYPGNFEYYLEKKAMGSTSANIDVSGQGVNVKSQKKGNAREEKRLKREKERERKEHNAVLAKKVKKLNTKKERIEDELYVMERILSNPVHDEPTRRNYRVKLEKIKKKLLKIEDQIGKLQTKFLANS